MYKLQLNIDKPHDSFFKKVFGDINNTRDFLKSYLPKELSNKIDFDSMHISSTEKNDNRYKTAHLDMSVECRVDGVDSKIYIILEHKSYQDSMTTMQIMKYCMLIWEDELKANKKQLTPIIPFIFYHGKKASKLHSNFSDYFSVSKELKKYLLDFNMTIFDTSKNSNEDIKNNINNMFLLSSLLMMKNIFNSVEDIKPILRDIVELDDNRKIMLFEYFVTKKEMSQEKFDDIIIEIKGEEMPSLARVWRDEGIYIGEQRGEKIGEKIGEKRGVYASIKMGVEYKFSNFSKDLLSSIESITDISKLKEIQNAMFAIDDKSEFEKFVKSKI